MSSIPTPQDHFEASRSYQELYDTMLREVGVRIPSPRLGQTVNDYRRETLHALKRNLLQNHEFNKVNYRDLKSDALQVMEPQTLQACVSERMNPANVPPGQLKPVKVLDQYGRVQMTKFIGQESFVKALTRAGRRVLSFSDPNTGRIYDATKGSWR